MSGSRNIRRSGSPAPRLPSAKRPVPNTAWIRDLAADLTQFLFSRSIQIGSPMSQTEADMVYQNLVTHIKSSSQAGSTAPAAAAAEAGQKESHFFKEQMRLLADMGTGLWRLRQKLLQPGSDQPLEEVRRAYRHFQSVWDTLQESGVTIIDHTNQPYDSGLDLKVVTFETHPGIQREVVSETIKPSIYYERDSNRWLIQMGEVIVATPVIPVSTETPPQEPPADTI
ncbi:MAG: hypothetical protein JXB15_01445 [Anaerolineales bacterium]|nr:hypothetical protein [Anaerolineales bacterium]